MRDGAEQKGEGGEVEESEGVGAQEAKEQASNQSRKTLGERQ